MGNKVIAYDLGTGGIKASIFCDDGTLLNSVFTTYNTYFSEGNHQEQSPEDWWRAIVNSTKTLLHKTKIDNKAIKALAISGHSLGVVPIGHNGELLRDKTPIWSDMRATAQAEAFFKEVDYCEWYMNTGNGFPPECYSIFKIMWYRDNEPKMYDNIYKVIGTKDYCNYKFTGKLYTDYSYASGSGAFSLKKWDYNNSYISASGLSPEIFPTIVASDEIVGEITPTAAQETGLALGTKIIAGGVDNSCMALGAKGIKPSRVYTSLGSSSWIALISDNPILDFERKPYVFAHVIKGLYTSATCIFSAGSSLQWIRNTMFNDLLEDEKSGGTDSYQAMNILAEKSPVGSSGIMFNPSLAGGSMLEPSPFISGAFFGLRLGTTRNDIIRATMEGIALNLRVALDLLMSYHPSIDNMLFVGGGAKSDLWMQIFADVYNMGVEKTNIDQQAASLGAAALAFKGVGIWESYDIIDTIHQTQNIYSASKVNSKQYNTLLSSFKSLTNHISEWSLQNK